MYTWQPCRNKHSLPAIHTISENPTYDKCSSVPVKLYMLGFLTRTSYADLMPSASQGCNILVYNQTMLALIHEALTHPVCNTGQVWIHSLTDGTNSSSNIHADRSEVIIKSWEACTHIRYACIIKEHLGITKREVLLAWVHTTLTTRTV